MGVSTLAVKTFSKGLFTRPGEPEVLSRVLYAVPTGDQITKFWYEINRALEELIEYGIVRVYKSDQIIEKPGTECRIRCKTAWNADTLRGDWATLLILDEWQLMDEEAWELVGQPMLADKNGDAAFIYTPPSLRSRSNSKARDIKHAAKMYDAALAEMKRAAAEGREPRWKAYHWTSRDNPHISEEGLLEISKDMSRLGFKQEMLAEDVKEVPGALWTIDMIEKLRVREDQVPARERITIGVDPSGSQTTEVGIVSCCRGPAPTGWSHPDLTEMENQAIAKMKHYYVLRDSSFLAPLPRNWAGKIVADYADLKADLVVGERNYGGDMVSDTIHTVDENLSYRDVVATRGKVVRAQPVASLYDVVKEDGRRSIGARVHHVGNFDFLEDEMTSYIEGDKSPNRMDAMVWAITELMGGQDVLGYVEFLKQLEAGKVSESPQTGEVTIVEKIDAPKNLAKPTIAEEAPGCPKCGDQLIQDVSGGKRCGACGHQWNPAGPRVLPSQPKSRGDYLRK